MMLGPNARILYTLIALLLIGVAVLYWRVEKLHDERLQTDSVTLSELTLVDAQGIARIKLQAGDSDHPALIALLDGEGRMRWLMVTEHDGQSGLSLIAQDSPRWSMALTADGMAYEMRDGIAPMIAERPFGPHQSEP